MEKMHQVTTHLQLLQQAFREHKFTMRSVAKILKVDHKTVHNYVYGKTPISREYASKLAKATLSPEDANRFRKAWEKDEGQRVTDFNKSKKKQVALQHAKRQGFFAVISVYSSSSSDHGLLTKASNLMDIDKSNSIFGYFDLKIHRSPVDAYVDVYKKEENGDKTRVFIITPDYGLSFFPGGQTSEWTLNDGSVTTVSGTLGTDEDWKGTMKLFREYCDSHKVDASALIALAQIEVQNSMELEPESYEVNEKVIVEKTSMKLYSDHIERIVGLIRSKKKLEGKERIESINFLSSSLAWMQSLLNKASETVSVKAKLYSKIGSIQHRLRL